MLLSFFVFHFFDKNVKNPALCCTFPRQICTKSQKRFFVEAFRRLLGVRKSFVKQKTAVERED